jgi:Kef-type K+ transport system membrane component KefB
MTETKEIDKNRLVSKLKYIFSYVMICVYFGIGIYLLVRGWHSLSKTQTISIGILLIIYSIFRLYRVIRESKIEAEVNTMNNEM